MSKTQKNVGKKTFKKVAKKKVSKPSKKTGLKKKVVSMKLKRKVKKVHRKKMKRGGAKYLSGQTDLGKIWNTILLTKGKDEGLIELIEETPVEETPVKETPVEGTPVEGKKYVLFVIDMQNDFSDAIYTRGGEVKRFKDKNSYERKLGESSDYSTPYPVPKTEQNACIQSPEIGNFSVAGVSNSLIDNLVTKIEVALKDPNCTEIIFTRDYHPDGHMSFSKACSTFVPYCTCEGGNFPVHCLQGHSGSRLIPEIEDLLRGLTDPEEQEKVRILFKGFDLNCDSFTAVRKNPIDNFASNQKQNKPCSTVSGAYNLVEKEPVAAAEYIQAAIEYREHIISAERLPPYVNKKNFSDVEEFQVCGLAGDYCVRDTVVSLAQMFPEKQVTLLGGLTRYAVLPLFTMQSVPIHNYSNIMNVPNRDGTGSVPFNKVQAVQNFNAIDTKDNENKSDKSLYYYTLTMNVENRTYQLVQTTADGKELTEKVSTTNFVFPDGTNGAIANKFFHFITPPEVIIDDYSKTNKRINEDGFPYNNIKIRLYNNRTVSDVIIPPE